jgi:UDP-2,4-diacetamido-2,4,6-trideoxy-beta-L-altropyranose hydrolase
MSSRPRRVLFVPDSGPGVGGGHVMRCLSLADALDRRGAVCRFACAAEGEAIVARHAAGRFPVARASLAGMDALPPGLLDDVDAVVFDSYRIGRSAETAVHSAGRAVLVMDDLADRPHDCELLLDPAYGRRPEDYDGLLPVAAKRLVGPGFALLRREFAQLRGQAIRPDGQGRLRRVFMSFGLADPDGVTLTVIRALHSRLAGVTVDIALGRDAVSLAQLTELAARDPSLRLHVDATDVAQMMLGADLAIGAGGGSTWERACLRLPTLAVIVADNQRAMIQRLASAGVLLSVDLAAPAFEPGLLAAFDRLSTDPDLRSRLAERAADLCDGHGADRVADALLQLI